MTRHEDLRLLDPVDPAAPLPDGELLLHEILAVPVTEAPRRARAPRRRLGVVATAGVATAAFALALPRGGTDVLAAALDAVDQPNTILHYTRVAHFPGETPGNTIEEEVWQAADGSRQRVLTRAPGLGPHEAVVDGRRSETYVGDSDEIIVYEERAPTPDPAGGVGAPAMGDPRTLLERAQDPGERVEELGEARVRGIDVLRFQVGECAAEVHQLGEGSFSAEYKSPLIVSIAKDGSMPVRVEQPACNAPSEDGTSTLPVPEGPTVDYDGMELLPETPANETLLEMAPHPGAARRDGEDIDAAEERADRAMGGEPPIVPLEALHP